MKLQGHLLLEMDPGLCTGCGLCMAACSLHHEGQCRPSSSRVKVLINEHVGMSMPVVCMQCQDAPCATICPRRAITRNAETGAYVVDSKRCIGCRLCVLACPVGAVCFDLGSARHALKCDLCDGDPRCVKYCGPQAIHVSEPGRVGEAQRKKVFSAYLETVQGTGIRPAAVEGHGHGESQSMPAAPKTAQTGAGAESRAQAQGGKASAEYLSGVT